MLRLIPCYSKFQSLINRPVSTAVKTMPKRNIDFDEDPSNRALTLAPLQLPIGSHITVDALSASLTNFKSAKVTYRQKVLQGNHELSQIYNANPPVLDIFRHIFPELVQSRGITMLQEKDATGELFSQWKAGNNEVTVELDENAKPEKTSKNQGLSSDTHADAVFIGGPSTLTACLLYQLRYPQQNVQHLFTSRHDSNYDGSAYYYHQRDAAPVYVNRVNRGPYCVYIDLYKRLISAQKLADQAENDRHHVKISLSWSNIKFRHLFTIFLPNFWHMITDLWLKDKKKTKMAHVIEHARRSIPIVQAISHYTQVPIDTMLIHGKNKSNYVGFIGASKDPQEHFTWLNQFAHIPFHEISCEGFGSEVVQVLNFPQDGLISPMIIENLQKQIFDRASSISNVKLHDISRSGAQLKKLFVHPVVSGKSCRLRVTQIEWMDTRSGGTHRMDVNRVFLSLGPSGQIKLVPPKLTWAQHALQCITRKSSSQSLAFIGGYQPTVASLWRHTLNIVSDRLFRASQCLKDCIWASGSSSVVLLAVDLERADPVQLDVFSRFIDGVNQHWTLIGQRDVSLPITSDPNSATKDYRFFAIQMTGGGNFPSRLVRPDFVLNLLNTTEKMYGLDVSDHIMYDLVQSRGCGRSVSAQNTITFQNITCNAVANYGLGGIGMTTMFPNGEKMVEMIENTDETLQKVPKNNQWVRGFLNKIEYSFMADETTRVERFFGFDNTMTKNEKTAILGLSGTLLTLLFILASI